MSVSEGRHHQYVCLQHWPQQVHPDWNLGLSDQGHASQSDKNRRYVD